MELRLELLLQVYSRKVVRCLPAHGKAKDGITFIGEIDEYPLVGQFTTVRFEENDELIAVINDSPVDGRYQVYAILDPKSGLL